MFLNRSFFSELVSYLKNYKVKSLWIAFSFFVLSLVMSVKYTNWEEHNKFGDAQSLSISMQAGEIFLKEGFFTHRFNPYIQKIQNGECCGLSYYTHFPPLTNWLGGIVSSVYGKVSLKVYRLIHLVVASLAVCFVFLAIENLFNRVVSILAVLFVLLHFVFYQLVITQVYDLGLLFSYVGIYFLSKYFNAEKQFSIKWILVMCGIFFINLLANYEYVLFLHSFTFLYLILNHGFRKSFLLNILFGFCSFFSFMLKFFVNSLVMGGIVATVQDKFKALMWRSSSIGTDVDYLDKILGDENYFLWLMRQVSRYFDTLFWYGILIILLLVILKKFVEIKSLLHIKIEYALILSCSMITWYLVFPQHTAIHINSLVVRHLLVLYGVVLALLIYIGFYEGTKGLYKKRLGFICVLVFSFTLFFNNLVNSRIKFKQISNLTWREEALALKNISALVEPGVKVFGADKQLLRAKFLYYPPESFEIKTFYLSSEDMGICNRGETCYLLNIVEDTQSAFKYRGRNYSLKKIESDNTQ